MSERSSYLGQPERWLDADGLDELARRGFATGPDRTPYGSRNTTDADLTVWPLPLPPTA